jgi:ferredoxin
VSGRYLHVDPTICVGHRLCAEMLPELITLDDFGYPMISPDPVPRHLARLTRRTVGTCPALALILDGNPSRRARRDQLRPGASPG